MLILADMPILKASQALRCNEKSLTRMMRYWVRKAVDEDDLSKVTSLGIDETSFKRGQSYVTVIVDAAARRVIDVEEGRRDQTIIDFSYKLETKGGASEKIAYVTSDMSKASISRRPSDSLLSLFLFTKHEIALPSIASSLPKPGKSTSNLSISLSNISFISSAFANNLTKNLK